MCDDTREEKVGFDLRHVRLQCVDVQGALLKVKKKDHSLHLKSSLQSRWSSWWLKIVLFESILDEEP